MNFIARVEELLARMLPYPYDGLSVARAFAMATRQLLLAAEACQNEALEDNSGAVNYEIAMLEGYVRGIYAAQKLFAALLSHKGAEAQGDLWAVDR